jgi:hypothetical protein
MLKATVQTAQKILQNTKSKPKEPSKSMKLLGFTCQKGSPLHVLIIYIKIYNLKKERNIPIKEVEHIHD